MLRNNFYPRSDEHLFPYMINKKKEDSRQGNLVQMQVQILRFNMIGNVWLSVRRIHQ